MDIAKFDKIAFYHLRLGPGADLFQSLRDFLQKEGLSRAFVLSTIGSLRKAVINYPETTEMPPIVGSIVLEGLFEINGISGEVWRQDSTIHVHLHGSIAERGKTLYGGGMTESAIVLKLAELFIAGQK
ncbi:MAG: DNA-binding protein [Thermodesulfobacteriota bacterium]|nr:DNA-binding protein [Thermodesulfobacteriota bacterium]